MSKYTKRIIFAIALIGLVAMGGFSYYIYKTLLAPNTAFEKPSTYVYVETDATYQEVFNQLKPLLEDPHSFDVVAHQKGYVNAIEPGRYKLEKDMNNNQIIRVLRIGNKDFPLVFNNQNRLPFLAQRIAEQIEADSALLMQAMTDSTFLADHGFTQQNALNMYIPNTYMFYWNTSAEKFRSEMLEEYKRFWTDKRLQKAEAIGLTPNQVQILASIVQEETLKPEERKKVAGVYMNRLQIGMRLQADPTVIFAIKNKTHKYDTIIRRVLYKDLDIQSPYNTYINTGLPPGPICMPDISSIEAVLNFAQHDYLYFVADPDRPGYHNFSKTLSQHNRYKRAYVNWLNKNDIGY